MSLLQQITTADSRTKGAESAPTTRYIHEINFTHRDLAEKAFDDVMPFYQKIWANGTWDGIKATSGKTPEYAKKSMHSNIWVDEHQMGFSLCVSFSNQPERDEMRKALKPFFRDNKINLHVVHLNESERERINLLETATHSVEMDVSNTVLIPQVVTDFMNVALTLPANKRGLYGDDIMKDGFRRLKGYFASEQAAKSFADVCDLKVRKPLLGLVAKKDQEALDAVATQI